MTTKYITDNTTTFNGISYVSGDCITGVEDTRLKQSEPTVNLGSEGDLEVTKYGVGDHSHTIIKFPTSGISGAVTVSACELGFYVYGSEAAQTCKITQLLRNWVEAQATWNIYSTGNSWTTGGALSDGNDRAASATASGITMPEDDWVVYTEADGGNLCTLIQN